MISKQQEEQIRAIVQDEIARLYYLLMGAVGKMIELNDERLMERLGKVGINPPDYIGKET
jgi:hypothetical protein